VENSKGGEEERKDVVWGCGLKKNKLIMMI